MKSIHWARALTLPWLCFQAAQALGCTDDGATTAEHSTPKGSSDSSSSTTSRAGSRGSETPAATSNGEHFSFFVASCTALQRLSQSPDGFGGDLRYGEADGLAGPEAVTEPLIVCTETLS